MKNKLNHKTQIRKTNTKQSFSIELSDYNLEKANVAIVKQLFKDKPNMSRKAYAEELGCSERNLYRWILKYDLEPIGENRGRPLTNLKKMIFVLEKSGYKVRKNNV